MEEWKVDADGQKHAGWWRDTLDLVKDYKITPKNADVPDPTQQQISDYRRTTITVPYLNEVVALLNARFDRRATYIARLGELIPSLVVNTDVTPLQFRELFTVYESDLVPGRIFHEEIDDWIDYWSKKFVKPTTVMETLDLMEGTLGRQFANIKILLQILAVMPVTAATGERSFSTLKERKPTSDRSWAKPN